LKVRELAFPPFPKKRICVNCGQLMKEITEEFVERQVEAIKSEDHVKAVAVFGSYARNPEQDHNDLDIYIIIDGNWRKRETEEIEGIVVEKFYNSVEWANKYLEDAENKENWVYPYRWFSNPDIRYDPEGIFEELKQKAEEFKNRKFGENVDEDRFLYSIWDSQRDIEREEDVAQKRYLMYKLFDQVLNKVYKIQKEIPVKDNYRVKKLQDFDGYLYKLSQEFLLTSSTMKKQQKLEKIIEHVTKGIGEPNPEWKTDKERI